MIQPYEVVLVHHYSGTHYKHFLAPPDSAHGLNFISFRLVMPRTPYLYFGPLPSDLWSVTRPLSSFVLGCMTSAVDLMNRYNKGCRGRR